MQDGNKLVVFGSQLIGVIIVFVGLLNQHAELHSPRPTGSKTQVATQPDQRGNRFARLWEDPLENLRITSSQQPPMLSSSPAQSPSSPRGASLAATGSLQSTGASGSASPSASPAPIAPTIPTSAIPAERNQAVPPAVDDTHRSPPAVPAPPTVCPSSTPTRPKINYIFLWNIIDGNPIPEVKETRLRTRYAIVSAVAAAGYLPLQESILVPLIVESKRDASTAEPRRVLGYFETFRAVDTKPEFRVSLIWTPKKDAIDSETIEAVKCQIGIHDKASAEGPVHILNHGTSDDLTNYLSDLKDGAKEFETSFTRATMRLSSDETRPLLHRPIATDDVLVLSLVRELKLRIPTLSRISTDNTKPRIVIFTESDTQYSRAIVKELKSQLPEARPDVYSYLRGLDGRPGEVRATAPPDDSTQRDVVQSVLQARAISEASFGTSQFDYLRRLAVGLEGKKSRDQDSKVLAVGILGSDIYDKMLVLQAVRPELPSAIFFTTDLDALYLERDTQPYTRNLVVASADGLDANSDTDENSDNWKLPPMRDSYQTVLVREIRAILANKSSQESDGSSKQARIYEIAAGKSIDLHPTGDTPCEAVQLYLLGQLAKPALPVIIFILAMGNAFLVLWAIFTRAKRKDPQRYPDDDLAPMKAWARWLVWIEAALASAGLLFFLYELCWRNTTLLFGEPLGLGTSIWPSVMIRVLAFLVAVLLLERASYSFVAYGIPQEEALKNAVPSDIHVWRRRGWLWRRFSRQPFHPYLNQLFDRKLRMKRIIIASIAYLFFSFLLFAIWPPTVPARGAWSFLIEKIILSLGVALYIIHLIFCLELHRSALCLLQALRTCYADHQAGLAHIDAKQMLSAVSGLTTIIGKTLLYPLTVLILIILSRLRLFDNWVMTPSLTLTFALGAFVLVAASLILWLEGARLKRIVVSQNSRRSRKMEQLQEINDGVFAAWYNQPIFSAIFSVAAVFGSLTVAGPLIRVFFDL